MYSFQKLTRSLGAVLSGNVIAAALGLLTTIVLARSLQPTEFGLYSVAIATSLLLMSIMDLGMNNGFVVLVSQQRLAGKDFSSLATLLLVIKVGLGFLLAIVIIISAPKILPLFFGGENNIAILYLSLALTFLMAAWSYSQTILQAREKFRELAVVTFSNNLSRLLAILLILLAFGEITVARALAATVVGVAAVVTLEYFTLIKRKHLELTMDFRINQAHARQLLHLSRWNALSLIATMIIMRMDVFLLQSLSTPTQVAYYSGAMQLANAFPLLTGAITTTLLPKVSSLTTLEVGTYVKRIARIVPLVIVLTGIAIWVSAPLITMTLGSRYSESILIFQLLIASFSLSIIINPISLCFFALDKVHILTILAYIQLAIGLSLNLVLIPHLDAVAPAIASIVYRAIGGVLVITFFLYQFRGKRVNGEENS